MNKGNSNQNTLKTLHSSDDISKNMSTVYSTEMVLFSLFPGLLFLPLDHFNNC